MTRIQSPARHPTVQKSSLQMAMTGTGTRRWVDDDDGGGGVNKEMMMGAFN